MGGCRQRHVRSACALAQPAGSPHQRGCDPGVAEPELMRLAVREDVLAWAWNCAHVAT